MASIAVPQNVSAYSWKLIIKKTFKYTYPWWGSFTIWILLQHMSSSKTQTQTMHLNECNNITRWRKSLIFFLEHSSTTRTHIIFLGLNQHWHSMEGRWYDCNFIFPSVYVLIFSVQIVADTRVHPLTGLGACVFRVQVLNLTLAASSRRKQETDIRYQCEDVYKHLSIA